ncbi:MULTISPECIES: TonB-dependent receptor [unclassified Hyphomicrobium]|uniref:TonB-dependent receptor n=1 Tax=unclassified Hyphomicrobium TaxID=2619925 RepID=UPI000213F7E4|nr:MULTISPECIES: TonB-dependent receptor [unclassified Hyphomicrobium]CCB63320.1 putative ferrichrome-iron receptor [Hyphomicrobium sp. MC1]
MAISRVRGLMLALCLGVSVIHASSASAQTTGGTASPAPGTTDNATEAQLPAVVVAEPHAKAATKKVKTARRAKTTPSHANSQPSAPSQEPSVAGAQSTENPLAFQNNAFNAARNEIFTQIGTNQYSFGEDALRALPQGTETPVSKALLQAPGVSQDSAASGQLHVRNDHANVQYRINGILLPDGVSGFSDVLETSFISNLSLVTGALPAQYGLHTTGLVDITTRSGAQAPGGTIGFYGGSRGTFTPSLEYGGSTGAVDYFFTGRYLMNDEGIENPTSSRDAIHDHTDQEKGFGYVSAVLDDTTRLSWISGVSVQNFQIPNTLGLPTDTPFAGNGGLPNYFNSALLNENQFEQNYYDVIALQKKIENGDYQIAYFSRYSDLHFKPDDTGDLFFNGIASDVQRRSFLNGVQADGSYRLNAYNTLRAGFTVSAEQTKAISNSSVIADDGSVENGLLDETSKLGWLIGIYAQDEIRLTDKLTLNAGLRFDQMYEYVDANQWSPRVSLEYRPFQGTTLHAGYARYFTPPPQVASGPTNIALFDGTVAASSCPAGGCGLVQPERSHYFDAGITQTIFPGLEVGVDAYYKLAHDLLDDGQFGAALVLNAFNYEKAVNKGIEITTKYSWGNFSAYGNVAIGQQKGKNIISNQFLIDPDDLAFIADHYIFTDHSQTITASAGFSYLWDGTRLSIDMIYGSGLRTDTEDVPNGASVPAYTQVNLGISHEFANLFGRPTTVRFDVVNLFDEVYTIRDGEGIGVFAPQYGPRRGYFVGVSQKF